METRGEKYLKHLAESDKYVGYASARLSPKDFQDNSCRPHASDYLFPVWPSIFSRKAQYTPNLDSLNSMGYKLADYPSLIHEPINDSFCCGLDYSTLNEATVSIPGQSSILHNMDILREYCGCPGFPTLFLPGTTRSLNLEAKLKQERSEKQDEAVAAYQVKTCHRCLTTDPILTRFQLDSACIIELPDLPQREPFPHTEGNMCATNNMTEISSTGVPPKRLNE